MDTSWCGWRCLFRRITAAPGCAQTHPDLRIRLNANGRSLLVRGETEESDDSLFAKTPMAKSALRPDNCDSTPAGFAPVSLEPPATEQNSGRAASCLDPAQRPKSPLRFAILRGALAPSRSMSNFLAGKPPWYRSPGAREVVAAFGSADQPSLVTPAWKDDPRSSLGLQLAAINLPMEGKDAPAAA